MCTVKKEIGASYKRCCYEDTERLNFHPGCCAATGDHCFCSPVLILISHVTLGKIEESFYASISLEIGIIITSASKGPCRAYNMESDVKETHSKN